MATKKEETVEKSERQVRYEAYVEAYKKQNPAKYALRTATTYVDDNGNTRTKPNELPDEVPAHFV